MSQSNPASLDALLVELEKLPGVGPRSAARLAHHLLRVPEEQALALADAIRAVRARIRPCSMCRAPAESDPCPICADDERDRLLEIAHETVGDADTGLTLRSACAGADASVILNAAAQIPAG